MLRIIKSIKYSLLRETKTWLYIVLMISIYVISVIVGMINEPEYTGAYAFRNAVSNNEILMLFFVLLFVPSICAGDFKDNCINYEIMSEYTKRQIYFARAIFCYILAYGFFVISCFVPTFIGCIMKGYCSYDLKIGDLCKLLLVGLVLIFRIVSVMIFLSFLLENVDLSTFAMYMIEEISFIPSFLSVDFETFQKAYYFSFVALYEKIMKPSDMVPGFVHGKDMYLPVYDFSDSTAIYLSLGMGLGSLLMGYLLFQKRERK